MGGTSLINANVALDADPRVFENPKWPKEIKDGMMNLMTVDREHVHEMLRPREYPDNYPKLKKMEAMEKAAKGLGIVDIEEIGKIYKKIPMYISSVLHLVSFLCVVMCRFFRSLKCKKRFFFS